MFDAETPLLAVTGEAGIDLFARRDDEGQRRARFRCVATLTGAGTAAGLVDHAPEDRRDPGILRDIASAMGADPLARPFALTVPAGWPRAADGADPIRLFVYLDFFRAWQVADLAAARFEAQLARDPASLPADPGILPGLVAPVFDFNRLTRACALARAMVPVLAGRVATPGFRDDRTGGTGFALRMLGDLCLRADHAALGLTCFETAIAAGDNPFRRRRAIEAARAARDAAALARHRDAYAARWPLPPDLAPEPVSRGDHA